MGRWSLARHPPHHELVEDEGTFETVLGLEENPGDGQDLSSGRRGRSQRS